MIPESRIALANKLREKAEALVVAVGVTDVAIDCQKLMLEAASEIMLLSHQLDDVLGGINEALKRQEGSKESH